MSGFKEASKVSNAGIPDIVNFLDTYFEHSTYLIVPENSKRSLTQQLQKHVGDAIYVTNAGEIAGIEWKIDRYEPNNFFIETWSNRSRFTRGWLFNLEETNVLLYYFINHGVLYSIPFSKLKAWAFGQGDNSGNIYKHREVKQHEHDQMNDTWGRLVAVEYLRQQIPIREYRLSESQWTMTEVSFAAPT